tara:strand:- start:13 stop:561 length:549 start_codon:yes stop_codon:yes gene_type:complete
MPNDSQPEIITVNSEVLQSQIRDLLPSQNGFGSELQASNVITPIIDLTNAAEGSTTPEYLQRAWDFATGHNEISNTTTTVINTTGFWQVGIHSMYQPNGSLQAGVKLQINDGSSTKVIWQASLAVTGASTSITNTDSIIVFLRAGDSLEGFSVSTNAVLNVWYRQVASLEGTLTSPLGFSPT